MGKTHSLSPLQLELLMERYHAAIKLVRRASPDERERLLLLVLDPSPEVLAEQLASRGLTPAALNERGRP